jgi:uncharacterized protein YdeI (YjbR/CyaY-like superfamily)
MEMKTDARIDAYVARSGEFARPILGHLRRLVHEACPDVEETMKWGFPHFLHAGGILCAMAAFKAHCTFGFWHQGMKEVIGRDGVEGESAMGSFGRMTSLADLPADGVMRRYLRQAVALNESGKPARPRPAAGPRPELPVPADLAAALKKNRRAAAAFEGFSPSHRREYIEWITEAKRLETRQRRVDTTVAWLMEGKPRNWKYQNC